MYNSFPGQFLEDDANESEPCDNEPYQYNRYPEPSEYNDMVWRSRSPGQNAGDSNLMSYYYSRPGMPQGWDSPLDSKGNGVDYSNLYRYVFNSPTNATDPSGMEAVQGLTPEQFAKLAPPDQAAVIQREQNEIAQFRAPAAAAAREGNLKWFLEAVKLTGYRHVNQDLVDQQNRIMLAQAAAAPRPAAPTPPGFWDSIGSSLSSLPDGLAGTYLLVEGAITGNQDTRASAREVLNEAYRAGPIGQTDDSPRAQVVVVGSLSVATAAMVVAVPVMAYEAASGATVVVGANGIRVLAPLAGAGEQGADQVAGQLVGGGLPLNLDLPHAPNDNGHILNDRMAEQVARNIETAADLRQRITDIEERIREVQDWVDSPFKRDVLDLNFGNLRDLREQLEFLDFFPDGFFPWGN